jgi:hypothetical protein
MIGDAVLSALAPGAVLLNYDRGELVEIAALDRALASGQVGHAAIDADLFRDRDNGALSGPMQPYLALLAAHGAKLSLLPHAAADTDHPTRVAGAIQAVDQILDAIGTGEVRNLKGELPPGYRDGGATAPMGLGGVTAADLERLVPELPALLSELAALTSALEAVQMSGVGQVGVGQAGEALMLAANRVTTLLRQHGLEGPWKG